MPWRCKTGFGVPVVPEVKTITASDGKVLSTKTVWYQDRPICFDYDLVSRKYNIMLMSGTDEPAEQNDTKVKQGQEEEPLLS